MSKAKTTAPALRTPELIILDESIDLDVVAVEFVVDETDWRASFDGIEIAIETSNAPRKVEVTFGHKDPDTWLDAAKRLVRGVTWSLQKIREES